MATAQTVYNDLMSIFDNEFIKNIKKWLSHSPSQTLPCLEEHFPIIMTEKCDRSDFNCFIVIALITESLKTLTPSGKLKLQIEAAIPDLLQKTAKYFIDNWSVSNKKHIDSLLKTIYSWEKKKMFALHDLESTRRQLEQFNDYVNQYTILTNERKALFIECNLVARLIHDEVKPPADAIATTTELIYHLLYRIDLNHEDIPIFCLCCLFLSGKLWWDKHGYVSLRRIIVGYWRGIHPLAEYMLADIQNDTEGKQKLSKKLEIMEMRVIAAWSFDYSMLNSLEKLPKLLDDVFKRLNIDQSVCANVREYLNHSKFSFSQYFCFDDMKMVVVAVILRVCSSSEDDLIRWALSLKLDRSKVRQVVDDLKAEEIYWESTIKPRLESLRQSKQRAQSMLLAKPSPSSAHQSRTGSITNSSADYLSGATSMYTSDDDFRSACSTKIPDDEFRSPVRVAQTGDESDAAVVPTTNESTKVENRLQTENLQLVTEDLQFNVPSIDALSKFVKDEQASDKSLYYNKDMHAQQYTNEIHQHLSNNKKSINSGVAENVYVESSVIETNHFGQRSRSPYQIPKVLEENEIYRDFNASTQSHNNDHQLRALKKRHRSRSGDRYEQLNDNSTYRENVKQRYDYNERKRYSYDTVYVPRDSIHRIAPVIVAIDHRSYQPSRYEPHQIVEHDERYIRSTGYGSSSGYTQRYYEDDNANRRHPEFNRRGTNNYSRQNDYNNYNQQSNDNRRRYSYSHGYGRDVSRSQRIADDATKTQNSKEDYQIPAMKDASNTDQRKDLDPQLSTAPMKVHSNHIIEDGEIVSSS